MGERAAYTGACFRVFSSSLTPLSAVTRWSDGVTYQGKLRDEGVLAYSAPTSAVRVSFPRKGGKILGNRIDQAHASRQTGQCEDCCQQDGTGVAKELIHNVP